MDASESQGDPRAARQALFPAPPWILLLPARFSGMERLRQEVLSGSSVSVRSARLRQGQQTVSGGMMGHCCDLSGLGRLDRTLGKEA